MRREEAIKIIRDCIEADRFTVRQHFVERMDERGLFWPDVQGVVDAPTQVRSAGHDEYNRARWIITGRTTDGLKIEIVIVFDRDDAGRWAVLFTLYHMT